MPIREIEEPPENVAIDRETLAYIIDIMAGLSSRSDEL